MNKRTMELLLINYNNINNALLKNSATKQKFIKLITDLELQIKQAGRTVTYKDGMTAMEYAKYLAKKANDNE